MHSSNASEFFSWAVGASHLIGDCFDCAQPYIDKDFSEADPYVRFVSTQLFIGCHLTSESVLILINEGKEWDADLICRAVLEGTAKFVYMMLGEPEDIKQKAVEYWETLPEFAEANRSARAERFLRAVSNPDSVEWAPFRELLLSPEQIADSRKGMSRKERMALQEKWSFFGISKYLVESGPPGLRDFVHMAHGYAASSNLLHMDGDGIGIVWERCTRSADRQAAAKVAHAARVVMDICNLASLRLRFLLKAYHKNTSCLKDIEERYRWLRQQLKAGADEFYKLEYGEIPREEDAV